MSLSPSRRDVFALGAVGLAAHLTPGTLFAQDTLSSRVYPEGELPPDARLKGLKTLNDYFPFAVPADREAWETRKARLREQLLVALGLWPLPEKTPLNPVIHGSIARDGYTVHKVFFASMPGHYVCGNLYRPATVQAGAKLPAILTPHGHWANGRFYEAPDKDVERQIASKAEERAEGARYPLQARCATLARMGFIVFHYDMVGYADSTAIPHRDGFRDVQAELHLQNPMGLQTWNSLRALDFVESLPDVDRSRIGVTGASGGGTQTFILCALDDRPAAAFPAVMVSTAMQGGCVCENCSYLRVGTGNVEFAAMFAPKPLGLSGADDWTKEIMTKGYPELQRLYALYEKEGNVRAQAWTQFPHNYNQVAREFMYHWFNKHLLGKDEPVKEPAFQPIPPKELSVFDAEHPRPKDELKVEALRKTLTQQAESQRAKIAPKDADTLAKFRAVVGPALRAMIGSELPDAVEIRKGPIGSKHDGFFMHKAVLGRKDEQDAVPSAGVYGPKAKVDHLLVWVHPQGKASLFQGEKLAPPVQKLVDAGWSVVAPDVFGVGELSLPKPFEVNKEFAGYTFGYNRPLVAQRVHDILTFIAFGKHILQTKNIHVVGWKDAGPWAALARALAGDAVGKTAVDLQQFRFEGIKETSDPMLLPGALKYGGMAAFLALCAPGPMLAHNGAVGPVAAQAYAAAGADKAWTHSPETKTDAQVIDWLLG